MIPQDAASALALLLAFAAGVLLARAHRLWGERAERFAQAAQYDVLSPCNGLLASLHREDAAFLGAHAALHLLGALILIAAAACAMVLA